MQRLARFLPSNEVDALQAIYEGRPVPTWDVTPGEGGVNHRKWERLSVSDVVLLARDGVLFVSGVVTFKVHNRRLALDLWKTDDDGDTWECMYFLDDLRPQSIPQAQLNEIVGYKPRAIVQGFNVLDQEKSSRILDAFDLIGYLPSPVPEVASVEAEIEDPADRARRGRGISTAEKLAIERHAVEVAIRFFAKDWPDIREVGRPYDLDCRNGDELLHVEVKGTMSEGAKVALTRNEVRHAREFHGRVALFVQAGITLSGTKEGPSASGGISHVWNPWDISLGELDPVVYEYSVPSH